MNTEEKKLNIFVPIDVEEFLKSNKDTDSKEWYVRGYASTPDIDLQGDIVLPSALNVDYFKKHGWINYEHKQDAEFVVGVPTENCYIDPQNGLYLEAKLFKNNRYAQQIWDLAHSLSKSGVSRKLGFSIEGSARRRNSSDKRVVEDLVIRNVAVTKSPANPHATWEYFTKTWTTGHEINPAKQENASALRREDLGSAITNIAQTYLTLTEDEMNEVWKEVSTYLDETESATPEVATVLLQVSKGLSRKEAQAHVANTLNKV